MNVLYLTDRLSHRGGAPNHLLDVITSMAERHTITVAAASKDKDVQLPKNARFQRLSGLRSLRSKTTGLDSLPSLLSWADLVHIQNVMNPVAIELATQKPSIATIQDHRVFCPGPGKTLPSGLQCDQNMTDMQCASCLPVDEYRALMLEQTKSRLDALCGADQIVVLSTYMASALHEVGLSQTHVVPPPVTAGEYTPNPGRGFLLAGRIVHHKAPEMAYRAWKTSETAQSLKIAGLGGEKMHFPDAEDLGWLSRSDLKTAMANARAVLFPSRWQEPFGITGVEALSMGTPVIAKPTGGMADWCQDGCILVNTVPEMVSAIQHLDRHPAEAVRLGRDGFRSVRQKFSPGILHGQLNDLYESTAFG